MIFRLLRISCLYVLTLLVFLSNAAAQSFSYDIITSPPGAKVYLNNSLLGTTPLHEKLKFDFKKFFKYELKIVHEGYADKIFTYTESARPSIAGTSNKIIINEILEPNRSKYDSVKNIIISFDKMLYDEIKAGTKIGEVKIAGGGHTPITWEGSQEAATVEFNKVAEDELENSGFSVVRQNKLFSDAKVEKQAEILIGASLKDVKMDYRYSMKREITDMNTRLKIEWQIFSVKKNKVIGSLTTDGNSVLTDAGVIARGLQEAFKDGMINLLASNEFRNIIKEYRGGGKSIKSSKALAIEKTSAPIYKDYPQMVSTSLKSVVTIKADAWHGSGFFISNDGYILTNYHVVEKTKDIEVELNAGFSIPAELISYDEDFDVALIKLKGSGFKPLFLKTDIEANVGDEIIAIGTPLETDLGQSVSKGIISGLRERKGKKNYQTDANVNPGNSGGPMLNIKGEVIGIISSGYINFPGVNFAIPIDVAVEKLQISFR